MSEVTDIHYGPMHMSTDKRYEVQRTNHFRVHFDMDGSSDIELAVDSVSLPSITTDPIDLSYGNSKVRVAGSTTFDDMNLVVKDFIEADVEKLLWDWRLLVYNPETDHVGWASKYKKDGRIYQYGPDGTCVRQWKIVGAWPQSLDLGELNYDSGDKKSITMNISIDRAYPLR